MLHGSSECMHFLKPWKQMPMFPVCWMHAKSPAAWEPSLCMLQGVPVTAHAPRALMLAPSRPALIPVAPICNCSKTCGTGA